MDEARARTSGVDMPTMDAMEPIRVATSMMSVSVDAPLLPRRTSESPNDTMSSLVRCMMLLRWPSPSAADSVSRSVAMSRFETTVENVSRFSTAMPSSPPMAWISRIWSALVTFWLEKSIAACLSFWKSPSVP